MLLALLPSRETPQATRSSSSGTQRPMMGEDDGERRGAALDRFHLQDGGRAAEHQKPGRLPDLGDDRRMGRSCWTTMSPEASVPLLILRFGPREDDQR